MAAVYSDHRMNYRPETSARGESRKRPGAVRGAVRAHEVAWDIRVMHLMSSVLFVLAFVLIAILVTQWLANRGSFSIDRLKLSGDLQHVNVAAVREQALTRLRGSFFTLDLAVAKQAFEQLPWVRQAVVKRVWPHGIAVELQAHQPVAYWTSLADTTSLSTSADERLLNSYGEVFEANVDEVDEDLPHLSGPSTRAASVWDMYGALNQHLIAAGMSQRLNALTLTARSEWEVELDDGLQLSLGRDDEKLWERVTRFTGTIAQARTQLAALGQNLAWSHIDLRHSQGYAIGMRKTSVTTEIDNDDKQHNGNDHTANNTAGPATAQGR